MTATADPDIASRLAKLGDEVATLAGAAGRQAGDVRLIAVSKTRTLDEVRLAMAAGQLDFGENTVQDALTKIPAAGNDACWHFIGHLQSNKAHQVAQNFRWLHSAHSLKLLRRLQTVLSQGRDQVLDCLLQVNFTGEASKSGLAPAEAGAVIDQARQFDRIRLRGLMTIGVAGDMDATRQAFASCRELAQELRATSGLEGFDQLSMGMSGDYREAIAEGATLVRIGSAIFGPRVYPGG